MKTITPADIQPWTHSPLPVLSTYRSESRNGNRESDDRMVIYDCDVCGREITLVCRATANRSFIYRHRKAVR